MEKVHLNTYIQLYIWGTFKNLCSDIFDICSMGCSNNSFLNIHDTIWVWLVLIIFQQIIGIYQIKINGFNEESLELAVIEKRQITLIDAHAAMPWNTTTIGLYSSQLICKL